MFDENGKLKEDVAGSLSGSYETLEGKLDKVVSKNVETESPQSSLEKETKIINYGVGPLNEALFDENGKLKEDVADSLSGSYETLEGKLDKAVSKNVKSESPQFIIEGETKTINDGAGPLNADLFNEAEKLMKDLDDSIPKGYETLDEKIKKQEERTKIFDLTMEIASLAANNNDESGNNKIADCIKEVLNRRKNNYQVDTTLELGSQGFVFNDTQRIVEGKIKVEALVDEIIRDFKTGDKDKQERYVRLKENQKENFEGFRYSYEDTKKKLDELEAQKKEVETLKWRLGEEDSEYDISLMADYDSQIKELDQQIISLTTQIDAYGETEIDFSNMFQVRSAIDKSSSKIEGQKEKLRKLQRDEAAMEGAPSAFSKMVYNLENGKSYEDAENMIVGYRYFDSTETIIYDFSTTINPELDDRIVPVTYKELYGDSDFNKRLMGMLIKNEDGNLVYQNSKEFDTFFDEEFAKLSSQDSLSLASEIKALQDEMNKEAKKLLLYQSIESDVKESVQYSLEHIDRYLLKDDFKDKSEFTGDYSILDNYNDMDGKYQEMLESDDNKLTSEQQSRLDELETKKEKLQKELKEIQNNIEFIDDEKEKNTQEEQTELLKKEIEKVEQEIIIGTYTKAEKVYAGGVLAYIVNSSSNPEEANYIRNGYAKTLSFPGIEGLEWTSDFKELAINYNDKWRDIMTDAERKAFNYVCNTEGYDKGFEYLKEISSNLDSRYVANERSKDSKYAHEHPILASIGSVFKKPIEGIGSAIYAFGSLLNGTPIQKSRIYSSADTMRGTVSQDIKIIHGNGASFMYDISMSMADTGLTIVLNTATGGTMTFAVTTGVMGSSVFNTTLNDAIERGLDDAHAVALATFNSVVEGAMESYSLSHLVGMEKSFEEVMNGNGIVGKSLNNLIDKLATKGITRETAENLVGFGYALISQSLVEGDEESCTELLDAFGDIVIAGDLSQSAKVVEEYKKSHPGCSEAEANLAGLNDLASNCAMAYAGGVVSGSIFGSAGSLHSIAMNNYYSNYLNAYIEKNILRRLLSTSSVVTASDYVDSKVTEMKTSSTQGEVSLANETKVNKEKNVDVKLTPIEITANVRKILKAQGADTAKVAKVAIDNKGHAIATMRNGKTYSYSSNGMHFDFATSVVNNNQSTNAPTINPSVDIQDVVEKLDDVKVDTTPKGVDLVVQGERVNVNGESSIDTKLTPEALLKNNLGDAISNITRNVDGTFNIETKYGEQLTVTREALNSQNLEHEILQINDEHEELLLDELEHSEESTESNDSVDWKNEIKNNPTKIVDYIKNENELNPELFTIALQSGYEIDEKFLTVMFQNIILNNSKWDNETGRQIGELLSQSADKAMMTKAAKEAVSNIAKIAVEKMKNNIELTDEETRFLLDLSSNDDILFNDLIGTLTDKERYELFLKGKSLDLLTSINIFTIINSITDNTLKIEAMKQINLSNSLYRRNLKKIIMASSDDFKIECLQLFKDEIGKEIGGYEDEVIKSLSDESKVKYIEKSSDLTERDKYSIIIMINDPILKRDCLQRFLQEEYYKTNVILSLPDDDKISCIRLRYITSDYKIKDIILTMSDDKKLECIKLGLINNFYYEEILSSLTLPKEKLSALELVDIRNIPDDFHNKNEKMFIDILNYINSKYDKNDFIVKNKIKALINSFYLDLDLASDVKNGFIQYVLNTNVEITNIDNILNLIKRFVLSNSSEINRLKYQIISQICTDDEPISLLEKIENLFIKNNIPIVGKIYSCFDILHPNFSGFDFVNSMISPMLKKSSTLQRKIIAFTDLIKSAFGSNNRSVNNYLNNVEIGSKIFEDIKSGLTTYEMLSEESKIELQNFYYYLVTMYNNTLKGKENPYISTGNILIDIYGLKKELSPDGTMDYNLGDRLVKMFCGFAGIETIDEAKKYVKEKIEAADRRNRDAAKHDMELNKGDFVKGVGDITYLGAILQNGSNSKEYLGAAADSDLTPLDTDVSMVLSEDGTVLDRIGQTNAKNYGPIYFVLKNDERFITTRTKTEGVINNKRDLSKLEVFYTGVLGDDHYGIRTGFGSSEINYIVMEKYDPRVGLEIAMNGFYIPVANMDGKIVFTPEDFDNLRKKMNGLSYYGINEYVIDSSKDHHSPELDNIVSNMNLNNQQTKEKSDWIWGKINDGVKKLNLSLKDRVDLMSGSVVLFNTGSTGRGTNLPGDGDFDYTVQVDSEIYQSAEKMDSLRKAIISALSNGKEINYAIVGGDIRELKTSFIDENGIEQEVEIDITFTHKTDKTEYASDVAVSDRLNSIDNPADRDIAKANIILAKQLLKGIKAYKPSRKYADQGGMGGIGVENWILQNGGTLYSAAKSFMEVAEQCSSFEEFVAKYSLPNFGNNHMAEKKNFYPHDDYITNMNNIGYQKMKNALRIYLEYYEQGFENPVQELLKSYTEAIDATTIYKNVYNSSENLTEDIEKIINASFDRDDIKLAEAKMGQTGKMYEFIIDGDTYLAKPGVNKNNGVVNPARAEVQEAASKLQQILSPEGYIEVKTLGSGNVKVAVQKKIENSKSILSEEILIKDHTKELMIEYVVDYLLGNFDSDSSNFIIDENGVLHGIDKEQSFKYLLQDNAKESLKLDFSYSPSGSRQSIYPSLLKYISKNGLSEDFSTIIMDLKSKISEISDEEYIEMFKKYAYNYSAAQANEILYKILERKTYFLNHIDELITSLDNDVI